MIPPTFGHFLNEYTMLPLTLLALVLFSSDSYALRSSTLPEDLHAFPKYKIHFLNGHPVLNVTAQRWLQHGLVDEEEFLGPHKSPQPLHAVVQGIAGGPGDELAAASHHPPASKPAASLERLRLGSADYLCLLLPPPEIAASPEEAQHAPHPIQTWELLQPLEGTCLYVSRHTYRFLPLSHV
jgi:protein OS-9